MPRTQRTLQQAFVLTVAAAGGIVVGCERDVRFVDGNGSCPKTLPAHGTSCAGDSSCDYTDECGGGINATCADGQWQSSEPEYSCNPPFIDEDECPSDVPARGDACWSSDVTCRYTLDEFCEEFVDATCTEEGWSLSESSSQCNPPQVTCPNEVPIDGTACELDPNGLGPPACAYTAQSPCGALVIEASCEMVEDRGLSWRVEVPSCNATAETCQIYDTDVACDADPTCGWRAPGCSSEGAPLVTAGCYPSDDCTSTGCGTWGSCTTVSYDPCYRQDCDACAAEASVCVPNEL